MNVIDQGLYDALNEGLMPDLDLDVDEWADKFQVIPKSSGSNEYGPYRTDRTPHARKIMKCLSDSHPCKRVVAKVASQMMKTQISLNWLFSTVHQSPSNFLLLMPTGKLHKRIVARIDKNIAAVDVIRERFAKPNSRDSRNNQDAKEYIGGTLFIATAGSAANLSEVPARRLAFDEIDRAEINVDGEGDPVKLGESRQTTFAHNRKAYYYSSPTIKDESRIDELFEEGTQREALAECIHCGHVQPLIFENLVLIDGEACYPCAECGGIHKEVDKTAMFKRGLWSDGVSKDGITESFTASAMFLPYGWFSWLDLMREYQSAKLLLDAGSEEQMIVFYNTRLARCWERKKEQAKHTELMARAENYQLGTVPDGGLVVTAAVDTQVDRLEFCAVAWGVNLECWVVDYHVVVGDPTEDKTWRLLTDLIMREYKHESGALLRIRTTLIDSGGLNTQDVYDFARKMKSMNVCAIKGSSKDGYPVIASRPSKVDFNHRGRYVRRGAEVWHIGTETAKDYIYPRYKKKSGAGAIHFSNELQEDYFKQLVSEYRVTKYVSGRKKTSWEKKKHDRNEALDLMVYNLGAAHKLCLHRNLEKDWLREREKLTANSNQVSHSGGISLSSWARRS